MACNTNVIRKAISEARNWCFTLDNYTDDEIKQLKNDIPILCAKFVVGIETGENNTPHLQGYIKLHKKKRPFALGWSPRLYRAMVSLETLTAVEQKNERVHRLGKCCRCLNSCRNRLDVTPFTFAMMSDGLMDGRAFKNT